MHIIDISIFIAYLLAMLGVGVYFMRQNTSIELIMLEDEN
jgi:SSS family solute:Na+ symporter